MAGQRLSKLQAWILKTTLEKGVDSSSDGVGVYILRKHLITYWLRENGKDSWEEARSQFNVSLTRSIKNLLGKELIRTFSISRPDFLLTGEIGLAWKMDAQNAKLSRGLKRLQNQGTTEEDEAISTYEAAKKARKERRFELKEITADDKYSSVQAIALTEEGKKTALMLTSVGSPKVSNKANAKT